MLDIKQAKAGSAVGMKENKAWMQLVISGYQKCNQTLIIRADSNNDPFTNGGVAVTTVRDDDREHRLIDPVRITNDLELYIGEDKVERVLWSFISDVAQPDQHKGPMSLFEWLRLAIGRPNEQVAVKVSSYIICDAIITAHKLNKANLEIKLDDGLLTISMDTTEVGKAFDGDQAVDCMVNLMERIRTGIKALR